MKRNQKDFASEKNIFKELFELWVVLKEMDAAGLLFYCLSYSSAAAMDAETTAITAAIMVATTTAAADAN